MSEQQLPWWKTETVYQIYPRSFLDTNNDGIGDIQGIISKLDYLQNLGIGILWLSPVYCSPNDDYGYDISDYCSIHPDFGTLEDMRCLIAEAKKRNIKIIMDLVINHTSDEHPWFLESKKSTDNPYRDYYIWQKGKDGKVPNNWTSFFAGSVWEFDKTTEEYYLHLFSKKQPDLNWHNPKVKEEIKKILHFWLNEGISGFRCDVINVIYKSSLEMGKKSLILTGSEHYLSQEGCHKILKELREEVFSGYDCFTVGETVFVTTDMANDLCAEHRKELDMVFSFEHMETDQINNKWFRLPFKPTQFARVLSTWQSQLDWNANYLENHDQPRCVSRSGNDREYHKESAKMLATLLFTLRGTPFLYQGQEIGMTNAYFQSIEEIQDVESKNIYALAEKLHLPQWFKKRLLQKSSRDNARTPMQWNASIHGGFSEAQPWLRANANYDTINVEQALQDSSSILAYYKQMIQLRKQYPALLSGTYFEIEIKNNVFAFERESETERILVILNMGKKEQTISKKLATHIKDGSILITSVNRKNLSYQIVLLAYEILILHFPKQVSQEFTQRNLEAAMEEGKNITQEISETEESATVPEETIDVSCLEEDLSK